MKYLATAALLGCLIPSLHAQEAQPSRFDQLVQGSKVVASSEPERGMWTMYAKDQQLLVDIGPQHLNQNFLFATSISKGISAGMVIGGMTWGDDVLWTFRKVGDKIHVVRRNVRFRANEGSPEGTAVKMAYSDSVLYALPIISTTPSGGNLVDMTRIFMSDDEGVGRSIGMGFAFDRSTFSDVKAFSQNVEIDVAAVYAGGAQFDSVIDPRGATINVHYSISRLPQTNYTPRVADDRIGYFLTVVKDFSDKKDDEQFVRYINRWNLKKKDPSVALSPPEKQITFYIEKTVPVRLRPTVQAGIEEWNKAFEKLGFSKAILVLQQGDGDTWDPEDIRYNTFRWITADAGFAMGPSRVNPLTGEILDADIIFDAGFMQSWKHEYENLTPESFNSLFGSHPEHLAKNPLFTGNDRHLNSCRYCQGMSHQMALSNAIFQIREAKKLPDEFVEQALKEVVMHEVGHTLGLRHNFKASTWKSLAEMEDTAKSANEGIIASVMDYNPANIAAKGAKQGHYYPTTIGPYDHWAIEYGYRSLNAGEEEAELKKIASRAGEPGLDYGTDEDTQPSDPDPFSNRFDLSSDPLEFARRQMATATELIPQVLDRAVENGEGYQRARQSFGILINEYFRSAYFVSRIPGGVKVARDHKGDPNARAPFQVVEAEKQRAATKLLLETALNTQSYPPQILNFLAATRWSHWGINEPIRVDYAIHDTIAAAQVRILGQLLSVGTLTRLQDGELKVAPDADAYTLAEHIRLVTEGIFSEWKAGTAGEYTPRKPYISSFRRNLQRVMVKILGGMVTEGAGPEDSRTLARMHLQELDAQITALLGKADVKLDDYSKAHLLDSQDRIRKVLNATVVLPSID